MLTLESVNVRVQPSTLPLAGDGLFVRGLQLTKGFCVWRRPAKFPLVTSTDQLSEFFDGAGGPRAVRDFRIRWEYLRHLVCSTEEHDRTLGLYVLWVGYQPNHDGCYYVDGDDSVYLNCSAARGTYNVAFDRDGCGYLTVPVDSRTRDVELIFHPKRVYVEPRFPADPLSVLRWYNERHRNRFFCSRRGVVPRPALHELMSRAHEVQPRAPFQWLDGACA